MAVLSWNILIDKALYAETILTKTMEKYCAECLDTGENNMFRYCTKKVQRPFNINFSAIIM